MIKEVGIGASDAFCHALTLLGKDIPKSALADLSVVKAGKGRLCPLSSQLFAPLTGRCPGSFYWQEVP